MPTLIYFNAVDHEGKPKSLIVNEDLHEVGSGMVNTKALLLSNIRGQQVYVNPSTVMWVQDYPAPTRA